MQFIHRVPPGAAPDPRDPVEALCLDIPPGECCIPHAEQLLGPLENLEMIEYSCTAFDQLLANQIGFGWAAQGSRYEDIKCQGNPLFRQPGPTDIPFDPWEPGGGYIITPDGADELMPTAEGPGTPQTVAFAASWIDLRTRFPPGSAETAWLQWQGVRGLVWGSEKLDLSSGPVPFPSFLKRDGRKRLNSWALQGTAYLQAPARWRRPTLYRVNGTNYTISGDGIYRAMDGTSLNLTTPSR
ncbi:MAG: hypothetical protein Q9183_002609 [Haloplaca sp. 2 TL-2023]